MAGQSEADADRAADHALGQSAEQATGGLNGRDIPLSEVPAAMLQPNAPVVPDAPGVTYLPGLIIGQRGDDE